MEGEQFFLYVVTASRIGNHSSLPSPKFTAGNQAICEYSKKQVILLIVRSANKKPLLDLHREIRFAVAQRRRSDRGRMIERP